MRDQRGPDRQTASLFPCMSCQNRQAANREAEEYPSVRPFGLSPHAFFLSDVLVIHQSPLLLSKLRSLICKGLRMWNKNWGPADQQRHLHTAILSYFIDFIFLTLCDQSSGWNVWQWGWEEREWRRETALRSGQTVNLQDHRTLEQGSMIHGLWVTSLRGDSPIPARGYSWSLCQRQCINFFLSNAFTKNIQDISFEWKFSEIHFCAC